MVERLDEETERLIGLLLEENRPEYKQSRDRRLGELRSRIQLLIENAKREGINASK